MARNTLCYQDCHKKWLLDNYKKYNSYESITADFNNAFGFQKSKDAVMQFMSKGLKITLKTKKKSEHYTKEQTEWLIDNYERFNTYKELTEEFDKVFQRDKTIENIRDKCCKRLKLYGMENSTVFRKGNIKEQCPIGTVRKCKNGTTYIKVKDSLYSYAKGYSEPWWLPIQKKIWQDHFGEVPNGKMVIFLDGNRENLDIENLYCIDRKISVVMAKNRWYTENRENTLTAIKWCELFYALNAKES